MHGSLSGTGSRSSRISSNDGTSAMTDRPRLRAGYPTIETSDHPLWAAQQEGWPDHAPEAAWHERIAAQGIVRADSAVHPAFAPGFLLGDAVEDVAEEPPPTLDPPRR